MLWYHDHAVDHTAENAYLGQAGAYIITDSEEESLNLPNGDFDIPLILSSKEYQKNGNIYFNHNETTSLFGDVIHVNGQPWPYFKVEPRKYRLRFLDAAVSRTFRLSFEDPQNNKIGFQVIASDAGLLEKPVMTNRVSISMAERYEIIFDFAPYKNMNITLRNDRMVGADLDYPNTDKVMRFIVDANEVADESAVPDVLRTVPFPTPKNTTAVNHSWALGTIPPARKV